ncbi:hypothetical protein SmJEL517_g00658 [Synchytrium microbalum]|uniref:YdbS-like PH domain-containing protein n=1 Tax=Synchytrium microbalum TaxID=1806994 RepID=A0A507CEH8_9FUNG|nr:uncharacterized protein SmJEL517_g00658 [Synchytrium microbalum]TPX37589.1 hypothetical protein SmJEL517_g00658 [Synchytrium microbalum]
MSCLATSGLGFVVWPCLPWWARKNMEGQHCVVDERRIHALSGWMNKDDKWIPLDRVQDVNIVQGWLAACYGVQNIAIQTAGSGSQGPEAYLIAVKDAQGARQHIIRMRDAVVHGGAGLAAGGGVDSTINSQPAGSAAMLRELTALREAVQRIEKRVEAATAK